MKKLPAKTAAKPAQTKPAALPPPAETSVSRLVTGMTIGIILVGALAAFVFGNTRSDVMLAVSSEERGVTNLQAQNMPNIGSDALISWSKMAISEIFTYNFNDLNARLLGAQRFFTKGGWKSFLYALYEQKVLNQVEGQRQFVTTIPGANTVISSEGEVSGTYFWTLQMNTITSVYTGTVSVKDDDITIKVARIPTKNSDAGYPFGIVHIQ